ncbi:unnamed protein product, partial [Owenia fusiformis]
ALSESDKASGTVTDAPLEPDKAIETVTDAHLEPDKASETVTEALPESDKTINTVPDTLPEPEKIIVTDEMINNPGQKNDALEDDANYQIGTASLNTDVDMNIGESIKVTEAHIEDGACDSETIGDSKSKNGNNVSTFIPQEDCTNENEKMLTEDDPHVTSVTLIVPVGDDIQGNDVIDTNVNTQNNTTCDTDTSDGVDHQENDQQMMIESYGSIADSDHKGSLLNQYEFMELNNEADDTSRVDSPSNYKVNLEEMNDVNLGETVDFEDVSGQRAPLEMKVEFITPPRPEMSPTRHNISMAHDLVDSQPFVLLHNIKKSPGGIEYGIPPATSHGTIPASLPHALGLQSVQSHTSQPPPPSHKVGYKCKACGKVFASTDSIKIHVKLVHNQKVNASSTSKPKAKTHKPKPQKQVQRLYNCKQCGKSYKTAVGFSEHKYIHRVKREKITPVSHPYKCENCVQRFVFKQSLSRHIERAHPLSRPNRRHRDPSKQLAKLPLRVKSYKCKICRKGFMNLAGQISHTKFCEKAKKSEQKKRQQMLTRSKPKLLPKSKPVEELADEGGTYKCAMCSKAFGGLQAMFMHIAQDHDASKLFTKVDDSTVAKALPPQKQIQKISNQSKKPNQKLTKINPQQKVSLNTRVSQRLVLPPKPIQKHIISKGQRIVSPKSSLGSPIDKIGLVPTPIRVPDTILKTVAVSIPKLDDPPRSVKKVGAEDLTCSVCMIPFASLSNKNKHMKRHLEITSSRPYTRPCKCGICGKSCSSETEREQHRVEVHKLILPARSYSVPISETKRRDHVVKVKHTPTKRVDPVLRDIHISSPLLEVSHVKFKCTHCYKVFRSESQLKLHENSMHTSEKAVQKNDEPMDVVVLDDDDVPDASFSCAQCSLTFVKITELYDHKSNIHGERKRGTSWKTKIQEEPEEPVVHDNRFSEKDGLFYCKLCPKFFGALKSIKRHHTDMHKKNNESQQSSLGQYKCSLCEVWFVQKDEFVRHKSLNDSCAKAELISIKSNTNVSKTKWTCEHCKRSFSKFGDYSSHVKSCNASTAKAKKITISDSMLSNMEKGNVDIGHLQCSQCEIWFSTMTFFKVHQQVSKKCKSSSPVTSDVVVNPYIPDIYRCAKCPKTFATTEIFMYHHYIRHQIEESTCQSCRATFTSVRNLKLHGKFCKGDKENKIADSKGSHTCDVCSKQFVSLHFLQKHRKTHAWKYQAPIKPSTGKAMKRMITTPMRRKRKRSTDSEDEFGDFTCSICEETFPNIGDLNRHALLHSSSGEFECSKCGKLFKKFRYFKMHEAWHRAYKKDSDQKVEKKQNQETPTCSICGKTFSAPHYLKMHMNFHSGARPYPCTKCDKKFLFPNHLKKHEAAHSNEKIHSCQFCKKIFQKRRQLVEHEFTHTGEKPFACDHCGKTFSLRHYKTKHEKLGWCKKVNKVNCPKCAKEFVSRNQMNIHIREDHYTIACEFKCSICSESFWTASQLLHHKIVDQGHCGADVRFADNVGKVQKAAENVNLKTCDQGMKIDASSEELVQSIISGMITEITRDEENEYDSTEIVKEILDDIVKNITKSNGIDKDPNHTEDMNVENLNAESSEPSNKEIVDIDDINKDNTMVIDEPMDTNHEKQEAILPSDSIANVSSALIEGHTSIREKDVGINNLNQVKPNEMNDLHAMNTSVALDSSHFLAKQILSDVVSVSICEAQGPIGIITEILSELVDNVVKNETRTTCLSLNDIPENASLVKEFSSHELEQSTFEDNSLMGVKIEAAASLNQVRNYSQFTDLSANSNLSKKFICQACGRDFPRQRVLELHELWHLNLKPYRCLFCPRKFTTTSAMNNHENIHMGSHKCEKCDEHFTSRGELTAHKRTHKELRIKPPIKWRSTGIIKKAIATSTKQHKPIVKRRPRKIVKRLGRIEEGEQAGFADGSDFICSICSLQFETLKDLTKHAITHGEGEYECLTCYRSFRTIKNLQLHERSHKTVIDESIQVEKKSYPCEECGKIYNTQATYSKHMINLHGHEPKVKKRKTKVEVEEENQHVCIICSKDFKTMKELNSHSLSHLGSGEYECLDCGELFTTHRYLQLHIRKHKNDTKDAKDTLKAKMQDKEESMFVDDDDVRDPDYDASKDATDELAWDPMEDPSFDPELICQFCAKKCKTSAALQSHVKVHLKNIFECKLCNATHSYHYHLLKHYQQKHADKLPISCTNERCIERFATEKEMNAHIDDCTKTLLFCLLEECSETFHSSKERISHVDLDHFPVKDDDLVCKGCKKQHPTVFELLFHQLINKATCGKKLSFYKNSSLSEADLRVFNSFKKVDEPPEKASLDETNMEETAVKVLVEAANGSAEGATIFKENDTLGDKDAETAHGDKSTDLVTKAIDSTEDDQITNTDILKDGDGLVKEINETLTEEEMYKAYCSKFMATRKYCMACGKARKWKNENQIRKCAYFHLGLRPYKCTSTGCTKKFNSYNGYNQHMAYNHKDGEYTCALCAKSFQMEQSLEQHMKYHSDISTSCTYMCDECGKIMGSKIALKMHVNSHKRWLGKEGTKTKSQNCDLCGYVCAEKKSLRKHRACHDDETKHQCPICFRFYPKTVNMDKHMKIHDGEKKPMKCTACNRSFRNEQLLSDHQNLHLGVKPYKCTECPQAFHSSLTFKKHQFQAHQIGTNDLRNKELQEDIMCDECGVILKTPASMTLHKKAFHGNKTVLKCDKCSAMFNDGIEYVEHCQSCTGQVGSNKYQAKFQCPNCNARFRKQTRFDDHKQECKSEPYHCEECDKYFYTGVGLMRHKQQHVPEHSYSSSKNVNSNSKGVEREDLPPEVQNLVSQLGPNVAVEYISGDAATPGTKITKSGGATYFELIIPTPASGEPPTSYSLKEAEEILLNTPKTTLPQITSFSPNKSETKHKDKPLLKRKLPFEFKSREQEREWVRTGLKPVVKKRKTSKIESPVGWNDKIDVSDHDDGDTGGDVAVEPLEEVVADLPCDIEAAAVAAGLIDEAPSDNKITHLEIINKSPNEPKVAMPTPPAVEAVTETMKQYKTVSKALITNKPTPAILKSPVKPATLPTPMHNTPQATSASKTVSIGAPVNVDSMNKVSAILAGSNKQATISLPKDMVLLVDETGNVLGVVDSKSLNDGTAKITNLPVEMSVNEAPVKNQSVMQASTVHTQNKTSPMKPLRTGTASTAYDILAPPIAQQPSIPQQAFIQGQPQGKSAPHTNLTSALHQVPQQKPTTIMNTVISDVLDSALGLSGLATTTAQLEDDIVKVAKGLSTLDYNAIQPTPGTSRNVTFNPLTQVYQSPAKPSTDLGTDYDSDCTLPYGETPPPSP